MRSFMQYLNHDTASFSYPIRIDGKNVAVLDNMSPRFDSIENSHRSAVCLGPLIKIAAFNHNLSFSTGTMQQNDLRN